MCPSVRRLDTPHSGTTRHHTMTRRLILWRRLNLRLQNSVRRKMADIEAEKAEEARTEYGALKQQLNDLWRAGEFKDCAEVLDDCVGLNSKCDTLRRYRARARQKVRRRRGAD